MIVVGVNYRVGFLGFLHVSDQETNFGLVDQRNALEWVARHVHGFGGNPVGLGVLVFWGG